MAVTIWKVLGLGLGGSAAIGGAVYVANPTLFGVGQVSDDGIEIVEVDPDRAPDPATPDPAAAPEQTAEADAEPAPEAQTEQPPAEQASDSPPPPSFDSFRIEPDGLGIVAGRAAPGKDVALLLNGEELLRAEADGQGRFSAMLDIAPSDQPRTLSLIADPDGAALASDQTVMVSPFGTAPPEETNALAETDPAPGAPVEQPSETTPEVAETDPAPEAPAEQPSETAPEVATADPAPEVPVEQPSDSAETAPEPPAGQPSDTAPEAGTEVAASTRDPALSETPDPAADIDAVAIDPVETAPDTPAPDPGSEVVAATDPGAPPEAATRLPGEPEAAPVGGSGADPAPGEAPDMPDMSRLSASTAIDLRAGRTATPDAAAARDSADQADTDMAAATPATGSETPAEQAPAAPESAVAEVAPGVEDAAPAAPDQPVTGRESDTELAAALPAEPGPDPADADPLGPTAGPPGTASAETTPAPNPAPGTPAPNGPAPAEAGTAPDPVPAAPSVIVADSSGVRVLQPAGGGERAPEVMSSVSVDTITYDPEGEVLLGGRGASEGFVRIYLDNTPITESRIAPDGQWRADLPEVDTGVYTLRVDEVDAGGEVLSRVETPFRREAPETVARVMAEETSRADFNVAVKTVQPGHTLWAIAEERYGAGVRYVEVFEANRDLIRDPDLIYPGQVFRLPGDSGAPG